MITLYQIGPDGSPGATAEIEDGDGVPKGWTMMAPPSAGDGERVVFGDAGWVIAPAIHANLGPTIEDIQDALSDQVDAMCGAILDGGFTPADGPLAGHLLQTRNNTDRTNWLTSQAAYGAAVAGGQGAVNGATFRDADNQTVVCSYQEGLNTLLAMAAWGASVYGRCWALKDQIAGCADTVALAAIDITEDWPS